MASQPGSRRPASHGSFTKKDLIIPNGQWYYAPAPAAGSARYAEDLLAAADYDQAVCHVLVREDGEERASPQTLGWTRIEGNLAESVRSR